MRFDSRIRWPNRARCAVVISVDFDAELVWRSMDSANAGRPRTLSQGAYGARRGVGRVLDVLEKHGIASTWMVPGENAVRYPQAVRAVAAAGHELGNHGYLHENFGLLRTAEQREVLERANAAIEDVTGIRPLGFRTPAGDNTDDTSRLLVELGFTWSSCMRGDDRPSFVEIDGGVTEMVEIPAHWELDDFPYFMYNDDPPFPAGQGRIASYSQVLELWKREFAGYYDLGLCFVIMFHPQTIGTPGRIRLLDELLTHVLSHSNVWFATCGQVADWWRELARPNEEGNPAAVLAQHRKRAPV
jgi:peptidoglycan/xylan/chitin deacetylase (PgdA/CDA1 family)